MQHPKIGHHVCKKAASTKASFHVAGLDKMLTWGRIRSCQDEHRCQAASVPSMAEASPVTLQTLLLVDAVLQRWFDCTIRLLQELPYCLLTAASAMLRAAHKLRGDCQRDDWSVVGLGQLRLAMPCTACKAKPRPAASRTLQQWCKVCASAQLRLLRMCVQCAISAATQWGTASTTQRIIGDAGLCR